jgi:GNAT superfamily N-acetyltransferase
MKIVEYDEADPIKVWYVNQLALDFALTPEWAVHIRKSDPRPFPCLAIYAEEDGNILGQVGIFRLPMVSTQGREDVGGIWAVSTHPQHAGQGIATRLLEEAHMRMRQAGLRFSTLGTSRNRISYGLYRKNGYEDTNVWATALTRWETAHQPTRLRAQPLGAEGYDFVEQVYTDIAKEYLGFTWRHTPFDRLRRVNLDDIWIMRENTTIVGYAFTLVHKSILAISNLLLRPKVDAAEAIAALATEIRTAYVQVNASRPCEIRSYKRAGYHVAFPTWESFMIKPLIPEVSSGEARQLFGLGTDKFLISWLDIT